MCTYFWVSWRRWWVPYCGTVLGMWLPGTLVPGRYTRVRTAGTGTGSPPLCVLLMSQLNYSILRKKTVKILLHCKSHIYKSTYR